MGQVLLARVGPIAGLVGLEPAPGARSSCASVAEQARSRRAAPGRSRASWRRRGFLLKWISAFGDALVREMGSSRPKAAMSGPADEAHEERGALPVPAVRIHVDGPAARVGTGPSA